MGIKRVLISGLGLGLAVISTPRAGPRPTPVSLGFEAKVQFL